MVLPELYMLTACMTMCLPHLEELSLDLGKLCFEREPHPISMLAPLAGLPHLARLSVAHPGGAAIEMFQAGVRAVCLVAAWAWLLSQRQQGC